MIELNVTREVAELSPEVSMSAFRRFSPLAARATALVDIDGAEALLVLDSPIEVRPATKARRFGGRMAADRRP